MIWNSIRRMLDCMREMHVGALKHLISNNLTFASYFSTDNNSFARNIAAELYTVFVSALVKGALSKRSIISVQFDILESTNGYSFIVFLYLLFSSHFD